MLDIGAKAPISSSAGVTRINWPKAKRTFDFDSVEILDATDEAIGKFLDAVTEDKDPERSKRRENNATKCKVMVGVKMSNETAERLARLFAVETETAATSDTSGNQSLRAEPKSAETK